MGDEDYRGRYRGASNLSALSGIQRSSLGQKLLHQNQSQQRNVSQVGRVSNQSQPPASLQFTASPSSSAGELDIPQLVQAGRQPIYTGYGYTASHPYDESALLGSGPPPNSGLPYQDYFPIEPLRHQTDQRHIPPASDFRQDENSQKTQQFAETNPNLVYGFNQSMQSQPTSYEVSLAGQSRQSAALVPHPPQINVSQYFAVDDPVVTSHAEAPPRYLTPQLPLTPFHQDQTIGRLTAAHLYPATMANFSALGTRDSLEQHLDTAVEVNHLDEAYSQYQQALRSAFDQIRAGRLVEASRAILEISNWMVANARQLGKWPSISQLL